jgi:TolB-like protein/class 3 adenylate cyclase/Flp pilus assembly protein TadD
MERRLVTILAADAVGYSRLVAKDEDAALALFKECATAIEERIRTHNGRVFGSAGDSVIAEFPSPVEALRCALEIQDQMAELGGRLANDRRMQFRVGLNLGDVVVEQGNLLGEAVNVAARLEGLSEPGGICVSGTLYEQVRHLPNLEFHDLGARKLKNIPVPVHVYSVEGAGVRTRQRRVPIWVWPAAAALLAAASSPFWWSHAARMGGLEEEPAPARPVVAANAVSEPSIAILPLGNLSGDPQQDYLSDGLTNDITSDLSKFAGLFVIANNSAATYKGKPTKVQVIGAELGVRYLLEGTVQKTPERLRINAQLIDTESGMHIWAERYDRSLGDIFAVQEDITKQIVTALAVNVSSAEELRSHKKSTNNLDAYDYYLRGKKVWADPGKVTVEGNEEARAYFEKAIALDPNYSAAYAELSYYYIRAHQNDWPTDVADSMQKAEELAEKAISLDDNFSSHWYLAMVAWNKGEFEKSFHEYETARQINPNDPDLAADMAEALVYAGEPERAIALVKDAIERNPNHDYWYEWNEARAQYMAGHYRDAIETVGRMTSPPVDVRLITAASYAQLGELDAARSEMAEFTKSDPDWSVEKSAGYYYKYDSDRQHWLDGLRKAGLKER